MTIGSLFSGIGGLELGLERAGLGPVIWQCEVDPFCRQVLAKHWPNVTRYEDVRSIDPSELPTVDVMCGGFPCQDVSAAGKGAGLAGARSGLWYEFRRIVEGSRPPLVVVENVASGARRWLPHVRRDLRLLGYRTSAYALSAFDVGAPHLRRRVFVVAADPERVELRVESGRCGGTDREGSGVVEHHGSEGVSTAVGVAVRVGREGSEGCVDEWRAESAEGGWWSAEPDVARVVDGLSGRLDGRIRRDRIRALGNAVVPQCAATIGRLMKELCTRCVSLETGYLKREPTEGAGGEG